MEDLLSFFLVLVAGQVVAWFQMQIPPLNGWEEEQERPHTVDNHMSVSVKLGLALMLSAEYYRCHVRLKRFIYLGENEHPSTTV